MIKDGPTAAANRGVHRVERRSLSLVRECQRTEIYLPENLRPRPAETLAFLNTTATARVEFHICVSSSWFSTRIHECLAFRARARAPMGGCFSGSPNWRQSETSHLL